MRAKTTGKSEFTDEIKTLSGLLRFIILIALILILLGYILSGIYVVKVNEEGILLRFGKIKGTHIPPGIHYHLPWPVDEVLCVPVTAIHRAQAGFGAKPEDVAEIERQYGALSTLTYGTFVVPYCITADKNIIHILVVVQYKVSDAAEYLFSFKEPKSVFLNLIQNSILVNVAKIKVDEVLTTGKILLQQRLYNDLKKRLDELDVGIMPVSVNVKNVRPPGPTSQAFKDVINAQEERLTLVHEAERYYNSLIPEAKAEASKIIQEAKAYKSQQINKAKGDTEKFLDIKKRFHSGGDATAVKFYIEAMEELLPAMEKYIFEEQKGAKPARLNIFMPKGK